MRERAISVASTLVAVGAGLAGLALVAGASVPRLEMLLALAALLVAGSIPVAVSSGNQLKTSIAVAAALPFVFTVDGSVDLAAVIGTYGLGTAGRWVLRVARSDGFDRALVAALRRFAGFSTYAYVFAVTRVRAEELMGTSGWEELVPFALAGTAWFCVEVGLWALLSVDRRGLSRRYFLLMALQDTNVFVGLVATGALFGMMFEALGWWALPVAILPYSFAHAAFRRFQETRSTYKQTIRALARIPEAAGLADEGHAARTSALAGAMARDLGLTPEQVEDVEFAGLLHDIGRITLNEPAVVQQGWTEEDIARWGGEIIAEAPSLSRVAAYVRRQHEPYADAPAVAQIIKVAAAYDRSVNQTGITGSEALVLLRGGSRYDYAPAVIASLRRVLARSHR